jgi:hypothetical protein
MTREGLTEEPPPGLLRQCCVCHEWTRAALPVRHIERQSGAPATLYACPKDAVDLMPAPVAGELDD